MYQILNTLNGKRYIGSSNDVPARIDAHVRQLSRGVHHSQKLQAAWRKYGSSGFQISTLLVCSVADLILYEQIVIDHYKAFGKDEGYNVCPRAGSVVGRKHGEKAKGKISDYQRGRPKSEEWKAKRRGKKRTVPLSAESRKRMSDAHKGVALSEKHRASLSAAQRGLKKRMSPEARAKLVLRNKTMVFTPEMRAKMSEKACANAAATREKRSAGLKRYYARNKRVVSDETRAKISTSSKGKRHTEETRQKMSDAKRGRKLSLEHKAKISAAGKGRKITEEHKQRISERNKGKLHQNTRAAVAESNRRRAKRIKETGEGKLGWYTAPLMQ